MTDIVVDWPGVSGATYKYWGYPLGSNFKAEGGNYIFARLTESGWEPIYIGQTEDLKERLYTNLDCHHQYDRIIACGATHIFAKITKGGKQTRLDEETDLRNNFNTACNDQ